MRDATYVMRHASAFTPTEAGHDSVRVEELALSATADTCDGAARCGVCPGVYPQADKAKPTEGDGAPRGADSDVLAPAARHVPGAKAAGLTTKAG